MITSFLLHVVNSCSERSFWKLISFRSGHVMLCVERSTAASSLLSKNRKIQVEMSSPGNESPNSMSSLKSSLSDFGRLMRQSSSSSPMPSMWYFRFSIVFSIFRSSFSSSSRLIWLLSSSADADCCWDFMTDLRCEMYSQAWKNFDQSMVQTGFADFPHFF